jgi:hypothetical protein
LEQRNDSRIGLFRASILIPGQDVFQDLSNFEPGRPLASPSGLFHWLARSLWLRDAFGVSTSTPVPNRMRPAMLTLIVMTALGRPLERFWKTGGLNLQTDHSLHHTDSDAPAR